jgi:hypothetical protein
VAGLDDLPKNQSLALRWEALAAKFAGPENIVRLNGDVWKKHLMASYALVL